MNVRRSVRLSVRALVAQKVRAVLAVTSVSIGVAAVILISAIAAGAEREAEQRMAAMGTNLIVVRPARVERSTARKTMSGFVSTLRVEDYEAIARLPFVVAAVPGAERGARVQAGSAGTAANVIGTSPAYPAVRNARIREGRFFDADDDRLARRVAVLGSRVAAALFDGGQAPRLSGQARAPVLQQIRVRGVPYDVIGVLESKGALPDGSDEDGQILIPIRTALRRFLNTTSLTTVWVKWRADVQAVDDAAAIAALVRARHGRDDFSVQNTAKFAAMQKQIAGYLEKLGLGIGGITLLLGGSGILALMMMSVKQRTAEIGLRMALGATPRAIVVQFLFEATLLAMGGWAAGLAIGGLGAFVVNLASQWTLGWPVGASLLSAAMVVVAGIGFGAFPARRASLLPPMEALRAQ